MYAYFALTAAFAERETVMMTLTDYFNHISTEDFVAGAFTSTECGRREVKPVKHPVGRPKRPLEMSEAQANKESIQQVAPILADSKEPTSGKSIRCQYTAKQKQRVVLYARHHGVHPAERK